MSGDNNQRVSKTRNSSLIWTHVMIITMAEYKAVNRFICRCSAFYHHHWSSRLLLIHPLATSWMPSLIIFEKISYFHSQINITKLKLLNLYHHCIDVLLLVSFLFVPVAAAAAVSAVEARNWVKFYLFFWSH